MTWKEKMWSPGDSQVKRPLFPDEVYEAKPDLILPFFCTFLEAMTQSAYVVVPIGVNNVSSREQTRKVGKREKKSKDVSNEKIIC